MRYSLDLIYNNKESALFLLHHNHTLPCVGPSHKIPIKHIGIFGSNLLRDKNTLQLQSITKSFQSEIYNVFLLILHINSSARVWNFFLKGPFCVLVAVICCQCVWVLLTLSMLWAGCLAGSERWLFSGWRWLTVEGVCTGNKTCSFFYFRGNKHCMMTWFTLTSGM